MRTKRVFISYNHNDSAPAADLLRLCAFLDADAIPQDIFQAGPDELGEALGPLAESPLQLAEAIREAGRFSLPQVDPAARTVSLHRLAQEVLRAEMAKEARRTWAERAVRGVNAAFPDVEFSNWDACARLVPHAQALA